ncbi:MAG: hypothetical protein QGD90_05840 [Candidatus Hydrogenedentes bacterium]|nr:hypothetical protein [Candidatus Hydrogenedentota bacterium]
MGDSPQDGAGTITCLPRAPTAAWAILRALIAAVAVCAVLIGIFITSKPPTETARSRLATVLALAHHGTWHIDRPPGDAPISFEKHTIDKVKVGGHLISSKPPVLPLAMTAEYIILKALLGWRLDEEEDLGRIVSVMAFTLIGIPYLITLLFFDKTASMLVSGMASRTVGLAAVAFGTQLLGYATHINNHVPAACLLMIALYLALGLISGKLSPRPWRFIAFGLCGALAITIDMPSGAFVAVAGFYLLARFPSQTLAWATLGAIPPLALHFGVMIAVTGSPLPVQMHDEMFLFENSYWRNPRNVDALNEPKGTYLFHMTFGRAGIFALYPMTLLGLLPVFIAAARKDSRFQPLLTIGLIGFAALTAHYALSTNNYGGVAYGFRWYIVAMPVLLLTGTQFIAQCTKRWQWAVIGVMLAVSIYSGWQCYGHPWEVNAQWTTRIFGPAL